MSGPLRSRRLSDEEIEEFRKILNESTGKDFSLADAAKLADMLLNALALVRDVAVQEAMQQSYERKDSLPRLSCEEL